MLVIVILQYIQDKVKHYSWCLKCLRANTQDTIKSYSWGLKYYWYTQKSVSPFNGTSLRRSFFSLIGKAVNVACYGNLVWSHPIREQAFNFSIGCLPIALSWASQILGQWGKLSACDGEIDELKACQLLTSAQFSTHTLPNQGKAHLCSQLTNFFGSPQANLSLA